MKHSRLKLQKIFGLALMILNAFGLYIETAYNIREHLKNILIKME